MRKNLAKIAMIPLRAGSKRVPNKNLRMIDGYPLAYYIIRAVIDSGVFSPEQIFVNSEADEFRVLAESMGVQFYHRPTNLASDIATNDDFAKDFIENVMSPDQTLFQFLATSPLIQPEDVVEFVNFTESGGFDTCISVNPIQIEAVFDKRPINFEQKEKTPPSQDLKPVYAYACGMMAWRASKFLDNMDRFGSGYHGGDGLTGFYEVSGYAAIDVDNEADFRMAELALQSLRLETEPQYWSPEMTDITYEMDVPTILEQDGVPEADYEHENQTIINLTQLLDQKPGAWMQRLVNSPSNSACVIRQDPGQGNRMHYHPNWDEWWYILEGSWQFKIEDQVHHVVVGDLVFIPRGTWHQITNCGTVPAARLAVSRADVKHAYASV